MEKLTREELVLVHQMLRARCKYLEDTEHLFAYQEATPHEELEYERERRVLVSATMKIKSAISRVA